MDHPVRSTHLNLRIEPEVRAALERWAKTEKLPLAHLARNLLTAALAKKPRSNGNKGKQSVPKLIILAAVLALSGCAEATKRANTRAAQDACRYTPAAQFNGCVNHEYNRLVAEDDYNRSREIELTTLGGAAFINGYNMNRSRSVTCTRIGSITTCN